MGLRETILATAAANLKGYWPCQHRNLLGYSEQLDNAYWSRSGLSAVTANTVATADPLGGTTAEKLVEDAASGAHNVSRNVTLTPGVPYTLSCYLKAAERTTAEVIVYNATDGDVAKGVFNLAAGTIAAIPGNGGSATIENVGNGWYRCGVTGTPTVAACTVMIRTVFGAGTSGWGLYAWGAQLEAAAPPRLVTTYPHSLEHSTWGKQGVTIDPNAAADPFGTATADKVVESAGSPGFNRTVSVITTGSVVAGQTYLASGYFKADGRAQGKLYYANSAMWGGVNPEVRYNLNTGTIVSSTVIASSASVQNAGNGWYRYSGAVVATATGSGGAAMILLDDASATPYAGDGVKGTHVWDLRLEEAPRPSAYEYREDPGSLSDLSGNRRTLALTGNPGQEQPGLDGNCVKFNGTSQYASRTDSVLGATLPAGFTFFAIVRGPAPASIIGNVIGLSKSGSNNSNIRLRTSIAPAKVCNVSWIDDAGASSGTAAPTGPAFDGSWHSVALARRSGTFFVYVDGVEVGQVMANPTITGLDRTTIAVYVIATTGNHFAGDVQHAAMWDAGLTAAQVRSLHEAAAFRRHHAVGIGSGVGV